MSDKLSIAAINAMDRAAFVARFGGVYERSPWVAEQAWGARPFAGRMALEQAMQEVVRTSGRQRQLELIGLHPRLGTRLRLSGYSREEQSGAGLLSAAPEELEELARLNAAYEARFGFPFILAVRSASVRQILDSCRARIDHAAASEFDESLRQVFRIAHFRLSDLVDDGV